MLLLGKSINLDRLLVETLGQNSASEASFMLSEGGWHPVSSSSKLPGNLPDGQVFQGAQSADALPLP